MRHWIPRNLGWKLGSLLLAVLLWIAVSAEPDIVTERTVPLLYRDLASDLLVTGDHPQGIKVELRGPSGRLTASNLADAVAIFDLGTVNRPGEQTFTISPINLNLPNGVVFLRAEPSQLRLRFARIATKDVPVVVRFSGELPKGYRIVSKNAQPPQLRVAGAEARVGEVQSVETDALNLGGVTASGEYRVNAFVSDPEVHFDSSPIVTVSVAIERIGN